MDNKCGRVQASHLGFAVLAEGDFLGHEGGLTPKACQPYLCELHDASRGKRRSRYLDAPGVVACTGDQQWRDKRDKVLNMAGGQAFAGEVSPMNGKGKCLFQCALYITCLRMLV